MMMEINKWIIAVLFHSIIMKLKCPIVNDKMQICVDIKVFHKLWSWGHLWRSWLSLGFLIAAGSKLGDIDICIRH